MRQWCLAPIGRHFPAFRDERGRRRRHSSQFACNFVEEDRVIGCPIVSCMQRQTGPRCRAPQVLQKCGAGTSSGSLMSSVHCFMAWLHRGLRGDVAASHMSPGGVSMISSARHRASYLGEKQKPPLGRASSTSSSTCADCPLCRVVTSHGGKASRSCSSAWFGE